MVLIATRRPSVGSRASYTRPMAPLPSTPLISYRPSFFSSSTAAIIPGRWPASSMHWCSSWPCRRAGACRQGQDEHQCMDEAGHRPGIMAAVEELKKLGRYEIKGVLGKGAMGLVYDALDPTLGRRVAIKTILTRNLDEATAKHYEMRFRREVKAVARLNHPHIVQVYDFGTEGDLAYIVMEFIEGKELKLSLIHISEPTRQAEISYAVFCLKKKK